MMNVRRRRVLGLLIGLGISILALVLTLRWAGLRSLKEALLRVDVRFLSVAVLVYLISMVWRAACWRILLGEKQSIWRVLAALNQGYLLNNILPWRMGELGRAILLGRRPDMSVQGVLSSIVVERLYDITIALTLFVVLFPIAVGVSGVFRSAIMGATILTMAILALWLVLQRPLWVVKVLNRLPGGMGRWEHHWNRFREGLQALRNPRTFIVSFLWLVGSWFFAGLLYWFAIRSLVLNAELLWAFFMLTVTMLGVAVPSSPGFIGVFEASGVLALSVFDVPGDQALAATLVLHAIIYLISSGLGAIAMIGEGETLTGLYRDLRSWVSMASVQQAG